MPEYYMQRIKSTKTVAIKQLFLFLKSMNVHERNVRLQLKTKRQQLAASDTLRKLRLFDI